MANKSTVAGEAADMLPVMAMAALSKGDEGTQALMKELVEDLLKERRVKKARKDAFAMSAIRATQQAEKAKSIEKANCSHKTKKDETRLRGQRLSGTGQICLVCTWCNDEFFMPPLEGQKAPPRNLIPSMDVIGG